MTDVTKSARMFELAVHIADHSARADIECHCPPAEANSLKKWDTASVLMEDLEHVGEAVEYLDLRGKLHHEPGNPNIVSFPEAAWK